MNTLPDRWDTAVAAKPIGETYYCQVCGGTWNAKPKSRGWNRHSDCGTIYAADALIHIPKDRRYVKVILEWERIDLLRERVENDVNLRARLGEGRLNRDLLRAQGVFL